MAAAKNNGVKLRITSPDGSVSEAIAESESIILGSGAQAAVKLQDPDVSTLHLMLKVGHNGVVTAIDLGSETGTKLGDTALNVPMALASGDVLTLGGSRVTVLFGGAEESAPQPPQPPAGARVGGLGLQGSLLHPAANPRVLGTPEVVTPRPRPVAPAAAPRAVAPAVARPEVTRAPLAPRAPQVARAPQAAVERPRLDTHLREPLPAEAQPTPTERVLQVALYWGDALLAVEHFGAEVPVRVGEARANHFHVFAPEVGTSHVLAVNRKDALELRVPSGTGVILTEHGEVRRREALAAAGRLTTEGREDVLRLSLHERAEVAFGNVAFVVRQVRPTPAVRVQVGDAADWTFAKIAAMCLLAFLAGVAAILYTPRLDASPDDIFQSQRAVAKFIITPEKKPVVPERFKRGMEEGARAKDEEGKFGEKTAKKEEADPSKPGAPKVVKDKKEEDRKRVAKAGLLGAVGQMGGAASNVFGPGGLGTGINEKLGGIKTGAGQGVALGVGGLGSRGSGTGGGGTALGLGGLGSKGSGRGTGGGGGLNINAGTKEVVKVVPGRLVYDGGLDKDVIQRVIRSHQHEIKYCYETELNKNPSLKGKVAVAFTIDATGAVSEVNVSESTLGNSTAEQCMLSRIRRWKFPEPKGGGVVAVTYPWLFAPAGSDS